jgi:hypothetical protein
LIAALNKYYRPMSKYEFYHDMDIPAINNAVAVAGFSKEIENWIFEVDRIAFEIFPRD